MPDLVLTQAKKVGLLVISQAWAEFYINKAVMSMKKANGINIARE